MIRGGGARGSSRQKKKASMPTAAAAPGTPQPPQPSSKSSSRSSSAERKGSVGGESPGTVTPQTPISPMLDASSSSSSSSASHYPFPSTPASQLAIVKEAGEIKNETWVYLAWFSSSHASVEAIRNWVWFIHPQLFSQHRLFLGFLQGISVFYYFKGVSLFIHLITLYCAYRGQCLFAWFNSARVIVLCWWKGEKQILNDLLLLNISKLWKLEIEQEGNVCITIASRKSESERA